VSVLTSTPVFAIRSAQALALHDAGQASLDSLLADADWANLALTLHLSPREAELTRHLLTGQKLSAAATEMCISLGTAKTYAQRLYRKLGVSSRMHLASVILAAGCHPPG
jgi:DNA-binding NarL/FixJ family response regulator